MIDLIKGYGKKTDFRTWFDQKTRTYYIYDFRYDTKRAFDPTDFNDFMDAVEEMMWARGNREAELEFGGRKKELAITLD